ncbi:MAG: DUF3179 domain-containing protein [Chitinophagaceae bacterium]|nr:DUF3179 domain-containing protein [Anaerolineae bacterium]
MSQTFDEQRAILLESPEPHPYNVNRYLPLAEALAQGKIHPHEPYIVAPVGKTAILMPMLPMVYHHIAQGWLGDRQWIAAFCCLCNAGAIFNARYQGQVYNFAAQGFYDVMVLMADEQTGSYWNNLTGICLHGPMAGASLERLNTLLQMQAEAALITYPNAQVAVMDGLNEDEIASAERWNSTYRVPEVPKIGDGLLATGGTQDERLPRYDMGLGVWTAQTQRYYPVSQLYANNGIILDQADGRSVVILFDEEIGLPTAFYHETTSIEIRGSEFILSPNARYSKGILYVDGQPTKALRPNHNAIRWYGFASIFPNCEIYGRG